MKKIFIIKQFIAFLTKTGRWWLIPVVLLLLSLGAILVFAKGSALAPFIYTLF